MEKDDEPGFLQGVIEGIGQVLYDTFVANSGGPTPSGIGILFGAEPGAEVGGPATTNAQAAGRTTGAVATGVVAAAGGARASGVRTAVTRAPLAERVRAIEDAVRNGGKIPSGAQGTLSEVVDGMVDNVNRQMTKGNIERANDVANKMKGLVDNLDRFDAVSARVRSQFKSRIDDALRENR